MNNIDKLLMEAIEKENLERERRAYKLAYEWILKLEKTILNQLNTNPINLVCAELLSVFKSGDNGKLEFDRPILIDPLPDDLSNTLIKVIRRAEKAEEALNDMTKKYEALKQNIIELGK